MSSMVTVIVFFLVGLAWWAVLQIVVSRGLMADSTAGGQASDGVEPATPTKLQRKNLEALLIGLLTSVIGASSMIIGLVSAFGGLDEVPPDQRSALISGRVSSTMSIAGVPTLFALVFGGVVLGVWWVQRGKIIVAQRKP